MAFLTARADKTSGSTSPGPVPSVPLQPVSQSTPGQDASKPGGFYNSPFSPSLGYGTTAGNSSARNRSANQVIRPGAGNGDPGASLPLGFSISVRLLNSILSTDTGSPVIAEIPDDVFSHSVLSIPAKTRAIGSVRFDEGTRRLQLKFNALVYPEGDQHSIQAVGMMADGSAGLDGDFHSGEASRQVSRFMGHFIGAMADGMKERNSGGPFGIPYEPGSVKNGILSGVSLSAEDEVKSMTESLGATKPTMTLPAGQVFLLFLEREYIP